MTPAKKQAGKRAYRRGLWAEGLCRIALWLKGYRIVAVRYKTGQGEIDLIAARGRTLAFIEVKARNDADRALESVQDRQCQRIVRAAQVFLARHPQFARYALRFDAMTVARASWPRHIENAFTGDGAL